MSWKANPTEQTSSAGIVRQRMFADLQGAEIASHAQALQEARTLRKVLSDLAGKLDGQRVQDLLHKSPGYFERFAPEEWADFFRSIPSERLAQESALVEIQRLRQALASAEEKIKELSRSETPSRPSEPARKPAVHPSKSPAAVKQPAPQSQPPDPGIFLGQYRTVLESMSNWQTPARPEGFKHLVSDDPLRWRRQSMALKIMAHYGINTRIEIDHIVARVENVKAHSNALRDAIESLVRKGLASANLFSYKSDPFQSSLILLQLSADGRLLCQHFGWEVVESDWERLNRLGGGMGSEYVFGAAAFGMHARLRGWDVKMLPDANNQILADVQVEKDGEKLFVNLGMDGALTGARLSSLVELQERAAFCTGTAVQRGRLVAACKADKIHGMAVDIETLAPVPIRAIGSETPLWAETWS